MKAIINVFGRDLMVLDCDPYTREWYAEKYGSNYLGKAIKLPKYEKVYKMPPPPPHDLGGCACFGSDEDSMQSCLSLRPKPAKRSLSKFQKLQGKALKFAAHLVSKRPEDQARAFVITLYLADDTVGVFEKRGRNTGVSLRIGVVVTGVRSYGCLVRGTLLMPPQLTTSRCP